MSIVVNIYYSGENGSSRKFAKEMISSGIVDAIRNEAGNIRYDYFFPLDDEETVLLIDSWENQESIDFHKLNKEATTLCGSVLLSLGFQCNVR